MSAAIRRPAAVLWDMDGTLVDTERYWIECEFELVDRYGDTWDLERAHALVGHDLRDSARILQQRGGVRLPVDDIVNFLLDGVIERVRRRVPWRPGARELLAELRSAGVPCALVTMSWQRFADAVVDTLPPNTFASVITGDMVERGKPHPEPYQMAAHSLGVHPHQCVAIEDSPTGMRSAVAAGCVTFVVPNVIEVPPGEGYTVAESLTTIPRRALGLRAAVTRRRPPRRRWAFAAAIGVVALGTAAAFAVRDEPPLPPLADIPVDVWAPYWELDAATASITAHGDKLRTVSPFWYSAKGVTDIRFSANVVEADTLGFLRAARASGALVVPSIDDSTGSGGMAAILADPATRTQHVDALISLVETGSDGAPFDGLDLDYEVFAFSDPYATWAITRPNWVAFVKELAAELHARDRVLVVTVPPVYDTERTRESGRWVYDQAAIGDVVDAIRIMAYDFSVETPGPIAPLEWVQTAVRASKRLVDDDSKIVLGIPAYGRNWVTATVGECPTDTPGRVTPTQVEAAALIAQYGSTVNRDPVTGEVTFTYQRPDGTGACTQTRVVGFVDAAGVRARVDLARAERIGGVALWALGFESADTWAAVADVVRPR